MTLGIPSRRHRTVLNVLLSALVCASTLFGEDIWLDEDTHVNPAEIRKLEWVRTRGGGWFSSEPALPIPGYMYEPVSVPSRSCCALSFGIRPFGVSSYPTKFRINSDDLLVFEGITGSGLTNRFLSTPSLRTVMAPSPEALRLLERFDARMRTSNRLLGYSLLSIGATLVVVVTTALVAPKDSSGAANISINEPAGAALVVGAVVGGGASIGLAVASAYQNTTAFGYLLDAVDRFNLDAQARR